MSVLPQPGSVVELRSTTWKVLGTSTLKRGFREVHCRGISGLVRDKEARFVWNLEEDARVLDPAAVELVPDTSSGLIDTKLHLEAAFRHTPTTTRRPLTLGRAAIDDLTFQHLPVEKALTQDRRRCRSGRHHQSKPFAASCGSNTGKESVAHFLVRDTNKSNQLISKSPSNGG